MDTEISNELLQLYMDQGYCEEAFEILSTLIEMQPSSLLYNMAGLLRLEDGFTEEAISFYQKAQAVDSLTEDEKFFRDWKVGGAYTIG